MSVDKASTNVTIGWRKQ